MLSILGMIRRSSRRLAACLEAIARRQVASHVVRCSASLLASALSAACAAQPGLSIEEQVQRAVIRYELGRFKPSGSEPPRIFCVGTHAHVGDPSVLLLAEVASAYQYVAPLSSCKTRCPADDLNVYPMPVFSYCGRITAGDVWFEPADQANVSVDFIAGPLWAHSGVYKLRRISGQWQVISYEARTVS